MHTLELIRNFTIIAHVDHGKSTLADRLIEECGNIHKNNICNQILDSMDIEKERGITIKAQTVRLFYKAQNGKKYTLNLIDTPGHVDFSYEVDRSLSACEGSILVVDSTQGVEAQTVANLRKAIINNHQVILVLNKIDLPSSNPKKVIEQVENILNINTLKYVEISAKTGQGVNNLLENIVQHLPAPNKGDIDRSLQAMIIDSWYDRYLGVVILVRIIHGHIAKGMKIKTMSNNLEYTIDRIGIFTPKDMITNQLMPGEVGFISGNIKRTLDCHIGDTITTVVKESNVPLPGFKSVRSVVFCCIYPVVAEQYNVLCDGIAKLQLNDTSFQYTPISSSGFGSGFRCGFLGMLHLDIIQERLKREFKLNLFVTPPSVEFKIHLKNKEVLRIYTPSDLPSKVAIHKIEEPWIQATIIVPEIYLGKILALCIDKRGIQKKMEYIKDRVILIFDLPLNEMVFGFYESIKSSSKGYASFDWSMGHYDESDLVIMTTLINNKSIDALSFFIHRNQSEVKGRLICKRLKELIPRHLFAVPIQVAVNGKIIARETISALRKDVTAKCYGGDITRKKKLLNKQKTGKTRMKASGNINIPMHVYRSLFKIKTD